MFSNSVAEPNLRDTIQHRHFYLPSLDWTNGIALDILTPKADRIAEPARSRIHRGGIARSLNSRGVATFSRRCDGSWRSMDGSAGWLNIAACRAPKPIASCCPTTTGSGRDLGGGSRSLRVGICF